MTEEEQVVNLTPRNYQMKLVEIALQQNTIIYLPTGTGKTFIAVMILRQLAAPLQRPVSKGGKISIMIVNTVALVDQQAEYIKRHTDLKVAAYSGDLLVDNWPQAYWKKQIDDHQILVMTAQILVNLIQQNTLCLNDVNIIVFDECHRAVNEQPMRQIMISFEHLITPPRVLGLTATLLNGNCALHKVIEEVVSLETTFHSKVATVDEFKEIIGFSTNPKEIVKTFNKHVIISEKFVIDALESLKSTIARLKLELPSNPRPNLKPLNFTNHYKSFQNLIDDLMLHISMLGIFGGRIAVIAYMIHLERKRKSCVDSNLLMIIEAIITTFNVIKKVLEVKMRHLDERSQIYEFSTDKVITLFNILRKFKENPKESLCGLVFVERRFTAKILYHILSKLNKVDPEFNGIRSNFILGFSSNPLMGTREGLYNAKMNRIVLRQFRDKEINVLIASNVLEEGVHIPLCTLVIKFDKLLDYRSYIQSKGRARHPNSLYYMMVGEEDQSDFQISYSKYQAIEDNLITYLVGQNETRTGPSDLDIQELYAEQQIPPYYVNGIGSAQINLNSAISLLCQYCLCLPSDKYTVYSPDWYITNDSNDSSCKVVIYLPTVCPISEPIEGPTMGNKKLAKKAAALKACILLHKIGELDDELRPKCYDQVDTDANIFFKHWPLKQEKHTGVKNKIRVYPRYIPKALQAQIMPHEVVYLHIIKLDPSFNANNEVSQVMYDIYTSSLTFGILSAKPLPNLCDFPVYVSLGEIHVNLQINNQTICLTEDQIYSIRNFHCLLFNDILKTLKLFLTFNNEESVEGLLVVPVRQIDNGFYIDFDVIQKNEVLTDQTLEPNDQEKLKMTVTNESHLHTIVTPWYRSDYKEYVVICVCGHLNAHSPFPSEEFSSYVDYFKSKYQVIIVNPALPLLLVKGLSKRANCLRPRGIVNKRNREKVYEEMEEHLLAELCIKQNFPADLWIQATLLPSILHRISTMTSANELREEIARDKGLGAVNLSPNEKWNCLKLDPDSLNYPKKEPKLSKPKKLTEDEPDNVAVAVPQSAIDQFIKDFSSNKLHSEYPWEEKNEPIDIERNINVTLMDIQYYENFISKKVSNEDRVLKNIVRNTRQLPAITFDKEFTYKPILLLNSSRINDRGPELADILQSLTSAKANDIINLERSETLGDSFLKFSISLFIFLKYPNYNEGKASALKGRLISNKNLYYAGINKNLQRYIKSSEFLPHYEWVPPYFHVPRIIIDKIRTNELPVRVLFNIVFSREEQIKGVCEEQRCSEIVESCKDELDEIVDNDNTDRDKYDSMCVFLDERVLSDKTVADCVEALLGSYLQSCGFNGGLKLLEWFEIIPETENIVNLMNFSLKNPLLSSTATLNNIYVHIPLWKNIEREIGYHFNNPAYLLQALTHSSYSLNRITNCYQRLEFLGDAILDFLITCHIYETSKNLNPGELTDLRSALVNNITFASFAVRCGFHKFLLYCNNTLAEYINNFVQFQESKNNEIDDDVMILLEEDDLYLAQHVDVPKVLGDVFEAMAGAIFLDSGMNLETVWKVFYKIMWKEIDKFQNNVPKNPVRLLYEKVGAHPEFQKPKETEGATMMTLDFMLDGERKRVYGFGENKQLAKRAAAKIALRLFYKK